MELTYTSLPFKFYMVALGFIYFALSWSFIKFGAPFLAVAIGNAQIKVTGKGKQRKEYKIIEEEIRQAKL